MPINFPSSPTLNQNYTVGTKTWVWNGYAWDIQPIDTIILGADTLARAAYGEANTQNVINQTQNTWITNTNTFAQAAFNKANTGSGNDLAQAAFNTANTAGANTVALQSVNSTQNTNITSINTFAGSAFASANAGVTLATAAYGQANNASGNTVALQSVNSTQNTNITAVNTFAGSAFNSANAGVTLATAAYAQANNASGNTVALQSVNSTQNTNILSVNTFAQAAFNKANTGSGDDLATAAYAQANNASGNTVALQSVNTIQNTNITAVNTLAGSAFNSANAGVTLATAAYGQANNASGNTVALQAQMTTTNTNITAVNTFADSAFNSANAGVTLATAAFAVANAPFQIKTQTTSNSAYYYLTMVDSDNATSNTETLYTDGALQWYPSLNLMLFNNATLSFTDGNQACTYLGFGTSIDTKFFYNGTANTLNLELESDAVSFHITDNGTDDFVFYKANGNLRLFSTEDTNGSIILGPSGSVNVGTGGIVFSDGTSQRTESLTAAQAAYASANAGVTLATAAYDQANNASGNTVALQAQMTTTNTNITAVNTFTQSAYDKANTGGGGGSAIGITNDTATNNTIFVLLTTQSSGNLTIANTSSSKLTYNPNTGTLSATVFSSTSDESLKENIKTIENPINTIMQLRGVTYTWKDSKEESLGLIAQEVEKVLPTVVRQSDNKKTVDYSNMIGLLVEAIKEQQKQIDDLKHQLNKHLK